MRLRGCRRAGPSGGLSRRCLAEIHWFPTKDLLLSSAKAGDVFIAQSCIKVKEGVKPAIVKKYAIIENFDTLRRLSLENQPTNFFEVIHENSPRCLYFDLDGTSEKRKDEEENVAALKEYVENDLQQPNLTPVVIRNKDSSKFSCHVIFPEIQFANYMHQSHYVPRLVDGISNFSEKLADVVDRIPYSRFQLFRCPWAAKLSIDGLKQNTMFVPPPVQFRNNPNTIFAGYIKSSYRRLLPPPIPWTPQVISRQGFRAGLLDGNCLYLERFQQTERDCVFHFDPEVVPSLRQALALLHPDRARHWWSWFRICGIIFRIYDEQRNRTHKNEAMEAFLQWSQRYYPNFQRDENVSMIMRSAGKRASGGYLLSQLVLFDNPNMHFPDLRKEYDGDRDERPLSVDFGTQQSMAES